MIKEEIGKILLENNWAVNIDSLSPTDPRAWPGTSVDRLNCDDLEYIYDQGDEDRVKAWNIMKERGCSDLPPPPQPEKKPYDPVVGFEEGNKK